MTDAPQINPQALVEALERIADGDVPREVGRLGRQLDMEWCEHGVETNQPCESCVQDFARQALSLARKQIAENS